MKSFYMGGYKVSIPLHQNRKGQMDLYASRIDPNNLPSDDGYGRPFNRNKCHTFVRNTNVRSGMGRLDANFQCQGKGLCHLSGMPLCNNHCNCDKHELLRRAKQERAWGRECMKKSVVAKTGQHSYYWKAEATAAREQADRYEKRAGQV